MAPDLSPLWEPLDLGPIQIRNRVAVGPSTLLYGRDNVISDRHIAYYRERARGGAGMMISEQQAAYRDGVGAFAAGCSAWDERAVPRFAALAEAVHAEGGRQFMQLFGPGVKDRGTLGIDGWKAIIGPSRVLSPGHGEHPTVMTAEAIAAVVDGFGQSARNVEVAGLDGVEVHGAHAWLVGQFLSAAFNRRTDGYGGTAVERCRLALEIGEAIRARTSKIGVGIQLSIAEYVGEAGLEPDETMEQLDVIASSGLFDYVNISTGGVWSGHETIPPMGGKEAFLADHARAAKELVGDRMKVLVVGRVRSLETAAGLVGDGTADIVAMTRAHIADPELVRKAREDREAETIPCLAVNECYIRALSSQQVTCLMNPATGREAAWGVGTLRRAPTARRVLVVGAGPAGLKAAAVAARRGHAVTLLDRATELGGHVALLAKLPGRATWHDGIDSWERDARRAGVEVRTGEEVGAATVAREAPDVVVVATGASWDRDGIGAARPDVGPRVDPAAALDVEAATRRALADPASLGGHVVIVDESGEYLPLGLASLVADAGARVEVVSRHPVVGEYAVRALEGPGIHARLAAADVDLLPGHLLDGFDGGRVSLTQAWSRRARTLEGVDTLVLSMLRTPNDELVGELAGSGVEVRAIGDALAPRRTIEVVYEGEKIGRAL